MATFSTSQECFQAITMTNVTVSATTRPSEGALDLFRGKAYTKIVTFTDVTTDIDDVMKTTELELVEAMVAAKQAGLVTNIELTSIQEGRLMLDIGTAPGGPFEPNKDGGLTG